MKLIGVLMLLVVHTASACEQGRASHFILDTIDHNKVVIFSKTTCLYSNLAKEQFQKLNYPFLAVELDDRHDGKMIQDILGEMTAASTVPRVFVDGKFIGGGTEIKAMYESGELKKLLKI
ncbi:glutaredoxin-C4-like [Bradysia coprophila]|uniref:glutaredoxin-C4-like n=1 Tax=Bradysia coprophila TaxID=38358 RepID=UPI00187D6EA3|nr:glutaredoxin-C4-like [Bradysia coprophila]